LASGTHSLKMYGNAPNVELDRVILTTDTSCTPTGTGDNCATIAATPTPSPSTAPTPTIDATPTPTPSPVKTVVSGDVSGDGHVTSLDLAILLTNWNKLSGATRNQGDLSGDGKVTSLDLAILLSNWGR
jgi:hypothetical protein